MRRDRNIGSDKPSGFTLMAKCSNFALSSNVSNSSWCFVLFCWDFKLCVQVWVFFLSVFNAAAGLEMVHQSSFGLNVVFSVTELFTELIYERERYFDTRQSGEKSEFLMHRFCLRFVECLARRIRRMHLSAASLPGFIWKQMNYLLFLSRLWVLTSLQNTSCENIPI